MERGSSDDRDLGTDRCRRRHLSSVPHPFSVPRTHTYGGTLVFSLSLVRCSQRSLSEHSRCCRESYPRTLIGRPRRSQPPSTRNFTKGRRADPISRMAKRKRRPRCFFDGYLLSE
ncbi:hypothetical protein PUN28_014974 [Cardiocondyla obscurior]|uniref:Uncharacterized protein n=1 Tax=Cardiocondyla obscurior TaxID=286306 RepID=A0AAW2EYL9_9HYME